MKISKEQAEIALPLATVMLRQGITEEEGVALIQKLGGTESQLTALRLAFEEESKKWGKADVRNVPVGSGTETK